MWRWCRREGRTAAYVIVLTVALLRVSPAAAGCPGDCNGDLVVSPTEMLDGIEMALGRTVSPPCTAFDSDKDDRVTVAELLAASRAASSACPMPATVTATTVPTAPLATQTSTPSETPTPSDTPTPTETPTPRINHPPSLPAFAIYRTYPGFPIQIPLAATDPDDDVLTYGGEALPSGAQLDAQAGVFSWMPSTQQLGPFYPSVTVTDNGVPPYSADSMLTIHVQPPDRCLDLSCGPATGCTGTLKPVEQPCCIDVPTTRVPEPIAACPAARIMHLGRNLTSGFGRMQDCDRMQIINFGQIGATARFNIEARCLNIGTPSLSKPVQVHARMETRQRLLFDETKLAILRVRTTPTPPPGSAPFLQRLSIGFDVASTCVVSRVFCIKDADCGEDQGPCVAGPFFDLEGADALFDVTVTDIDGVSVHEQLRVTLTFLVLDDLPDLQ